MAAKQARKAGGDKETVSKLQEMCENYGLDPMSTLFDFLDSDDEDMRFNAAKEIMSYMYPKQKAVEVKGKSEHLVTIMDLTGDADGEHLL